MRALPILSGGNVPAGVPACVACHGADGHGGESIPRLAGQHAMYVVRQLRQLQQLLQLLLLILTNLKLNSRSDCKILEKLVTTRRKNKIKL